MQKVELKDPQNMSVGEIESELTTRLYDLELAYRAEGATSISKPLYEAQRLIHVGDSHSSEVEWQKVRSHFEKHSNPKSRETGDRINMLYASLSQDTGEMSALAVQGELVPAEVVDDNNLSQADIERLRQLEFAVDRGIEGYLVAGAALREIQESRLYAKYETFEQYCEARFGFSKSRAYQLIDAWKTVQGLSTIVEELPSKEAHVRELAKLPEAQRIEVWRAVLCDAEPVTAPKIRAAAEKLALPPADKPSLPATLSRKLREGKNIPEFFLGEELKTSPSPSLEGGGQEWNPNLWETPDWLAEAIACLIEPDEVEVLEPCAGTGQLVSAIRLNDSVEFICAIEILPDRAEALRARNIEASRTVEADFLSYQFSQKYDVVITNPPFNIGLEILEKSLSLLHDGGRCLFLLPVAYFQSQERGSRFLGMDAHIHKVYPIVGRVAYLKDGVPVSGRQCEDAIFDIRVGKEDGCMEFISQ